MFWSNWTPNRSRTVAVQWRQTTQKGPILDVGVWQLRTSGPQTSLRQRSRLRNWQRARDELEADGVALSDGYNLRYVDSAIVPGTHISAGREIEMYDVGQIADAQKPPTLNTEAFEGLSPELQSGGNGSWGCLGSAWRQWRIRRHRQRHRQRGQRWQCQSQQSTRHRRYANQHIRVDENGNLIYAASFSGDDGGRTSSGRGQRLYSNASGSVFYDANLRNPASDEAQQLADQITVNVQVGDETVDAVTSTSENRRGSE